MSSRALRKLTETSDIIDCQCLSEDSDEVISGSPVASKFSLLRITKDGEILSPQSDSKQHSKVDVAPSKSRKRQRKKNKKKRDQPAPHIDSGDTYMESSPTPTDQSQKGLLAELLTVNTKLLDPFQELSRLFGSHIVGAARTISSADRRSHLKRGLLVRIKPSWPRVVRFGLDMIHTENGEFTFTHSKEYCNTQKSFYTALETMDPNNIMQILASCPYHIDSLLQLSETMMHQDNSEVAIDLLERALHAYQSAFHTSFNPAISVYHLNYRKQENRGLFVALFRYINVIGTRGCYRNALEYSKILLSLDVQGDPLAVVLMIDYYASLACQFDFLLKFYGQLNPLRNLDLLPNFAYSIPLALFLKSQLNSKDCSGDCLEADKKLQDALIMFPGFVTRLMKYTTLGGVTNLDKSKLFGEEIRTESDSLGRLLDLYVTRTHTLWTSPDTVSWLERNIVTVLGSVEPVSTTGEPVQPDSRLKQYSKKRRSLYPALPRNVLRHLILCDLPDAPPLFPRGSQIPHIYNFDPLPPQDAINYCDPSEERDHSRIAGPEGGFFYSLITSLLPDDSLQQAMQRFIRPANENDPDPVDPGGAQPLGLAADRLAASLRRVLDHIDPRRAWSGTADDNAPQDTNEEPQPDEI